MIVVSGANPINGPPKVGRSSPSNKPSAKTDAAIVAPVEPMLIEA